jgi:hypothetical protein
VDPVTIVMLAIAGLFVLAILLLGRFYPGSGAEQLDWRPTRSPELEAANEIDDVDQMREAVNRRRRRRGEPELTEDELHEQVAADLRERRAHAGGAPEPRREPPA